MIIGGCSSFRTVDGWMIQQGEFEFEIYYHYYYYFQGQTFVDRDWNYMECTGNKNFEWENAIDGGNKYKLGFWDVATDEQYFQRYYN